MISETAMEDIARLRADGIDVPPREVVRLNALGLKLERGAESPDVYAAPRVAFLGKVVLHEPTLGAEMWLREALDVFDEEDEETFVSLRVLSCVVPWRELPEPTDRRAVQKAIKAMLKRIGGSTLRQLDNALAWCIGGNLPESGEKPPAKPSGEVVMDDYADELPARYAPEFGLFYRGMAVRVGTAADMKDMTISAMLAVCDRAEMIATSSPFGGGRDRKATRNKATGDYFRALDAIRAAASGNHEQGLAGRGQANGGPDNKGNDTEEKQRAWEVPPDNCDVPPDVGALFSDDCVHGDSIPQEAV